jgi:uncharacterized protein GlcG (DUF336 family)
MQLAKLVPAILGAVLLVAPVSRAQDLIVRHRLPLSLALEAAQAAVEACAKQGYGVSAVVIDRDGARQVVLRGDDAEIGTLDGSYYKAFTALNLAHDADSSKAVADRLLKNPESAQLGKLPNIVLTGGGVTISLGKEMIGAIGVGGATGNNGDETCARAGIDKIRDRIK